MASTKDTIRHFLRCFDFYAEEIRDTLFSSIRLSNTTYAYLPTDQQHALVSRIVSKLRDSIVRQNAEPLTDAVHHEHVGEIVSLDDIRTLLTITRRSTFAALTPCLVKDVSSGVHGLDLVANMLEEADLYEIRKQLKQTQEEVSEQASSLLLFQSLAEYAVDGIMVVDEKGSIIYANPAFKELTGYGEELIGSDARTLMVATAEQIAEAEEQFGEHDAWQEVYTYRRKDSTTFEGQVSGFKIYDRDGNLFAWAGIIRDVTEQLRAAREQQETKEQLIEVQQDTLRQLETPLMPLHDDVVAMPLIGKIDENRARQVTETLLEGVAERRATTAIIDITGVPVVDTYVASSLIEAAQAVNLLGAEVILTGIRPDVAQMLVDLDVDLSNIRTFSKFQRGVMKALSKRVSRNKISKKNGSSHRSTNEDAGNNS